MPFAAPRFLCGLFPVNPVRQALRCAFFPPDTCRHAFPAGFSPCVFPPGSLLRLFTEPRPGREPGRGGCRTAGIFPLCPCAWNRGGAKSLPCPYIYGKRDSRLRYLFLYLPYEDYDFRPCAPVPGRTGFDHGDHGPHLSAAWERGRHKDFHAAIPFAALPGQEPDRIHAAAGRSAHLPVRQYGQPFQLGAYRSPDMPRTSRFRADEILDALHGTLFRHHCPFRPPQRPYEGALPDRQRRTPRAPPDRQTLQPLLPGCRGRVRLHVRAGARRTEGIQRCPGAVFPASAFRELRGAGRPQRGLCTAGAGSDGRLRAFLRADPRLQRARPAARRLGGVASPGACRGAQADRRRGILHPQGALPAADCRQRPAGRGDPPRPVHSRRTGEILLLGCGFRRPAL